MTGGAQAAVRFFGPDLTWTYHIHTACSAAVQHFVWTTLLAGLRAECQAAVVLVALPPELWYLILERLPLQGMSAPSAKLGAF
jgi:RsiW-degrading membrane proteinase PrsW (M82 family)